MSDSRDIGYAALFLGAGVWFFFRGFKRLRRKRKIENIPTSTVRGLAMGLVELIGTAKKVSDIKSPLSGANCVLYRYTIERYQSSDRSGSWVEIAKGDSFALPFWLEDATGRIMVFPQGAEFIIPVDYEFQTGWGKSLPENLIEFLEKNNIRYKSFLGSYPLRFREWMICENESVYVMGTAAETGGVDYMDTHKEKLMRRLEELKHDPAKMSEVDLNKDGEVSIEEWDQAVAKLEQGVLEEELKSKDVPSQIEVLINKGDKKEVFIISEYSQKDLVQKLSWQAFSGVFGGAALVLAMLGYLLFRLSCF